jgi:hypothetical protein
MKLAARAPEDPADSFYLGNGRAPVGAFFSSASPHRGLSGVPASLFRNQAPSARLGMEGAVTLESYDAGNR